MTKRIVSLLLAMMMLFCFASAEDTIELNGIHIYGSEFIINYPEDWGVSTDDSNNTEDDMYCGMLYSPEDTGLNVEIYKYYNADWADYTMLNQDSEGLASFDQMFVDLFSADFGYESLGLVYTTNNGIPFLIYNAADDYGPMYVAECLMAGWFVTIYGYAYTDGTYTVCRDLTADDEALFKAIVESYAPFYILEPVTE